MRSRMSYAGVLWAQAAGRSFFFFQAEDGIRDWSVTGVQTCALPISPQIARAEDDLFQTGGPASVRGFEADGLGPRNLRGALGGQSLLVINEELRFPI